jgi:hypothetical protein
MYAIKVRNSDESYYYFLFSASPIRVHEGEYESLYVVCIAIQIHPSEKTDKKAIQIVVISLKIQAYGGSPIDEQEPAA